MKVSRTVWIIIVAGFVIVAFASLGILCWQQFNERNQLRERLTLVEEKLQEFQSERSSYRKQTLESQLEETQDVIKTSESLFARPSWDIMTSSIFDIAEVCNVEVTRISSSGLGSEKLGGLTSTAQRFNITIEGDLNNLIQFLTRVNHDLRTGVIKLVDLNVPADTQTGPSANFLLVVYTYEGG